MEFKERLTIGLKAKGITQTDLAKTLNIRRATISDWKSNNSFPYADVAVKIAGIIGTTVEELITGNPPKGFDPDVLKIAKAAERLNAEGQKAALSMVEGLETRYLRQEPQTKKAVPE